MRVIVPFAPPACLSANSRRRGNVWEQREATEAVRAVAVAAVRQGWAGEPLSGPVSLSVRVLWPCGRKGRLPDVDQLGSFVKAYVDALEGIALGNDSQVQACTFSQERLDRMTTDAQYADGAVVMDITAADVVRE